MPGFWIGVALGAVGTVAVWTVVAFVYCYWLSTPMHG